MKKLSLFLVLTMILSLFSGFAFAEEPLEIDWIVYGQVSGESPSLSNKTIDYLNERFNIKINVVELNAATEQWNVYWASGESADYIQSNHGSADIFKLVDQGMVRSIPEGWLDEYAPGLMANVYAKIDPETVKTQISYNGETYIIPYTYADNCPFGMIIRDDYLKALGVTEMPQTLEAFHELCQKLTFGDPDGNGIDDTYALDGVMDWMQFGYLTAHKGFWPGSFYRGEDGKVSYTATWDEYKDLLHMLSDWYEEGLIDPEFVTDDRNIANRKFAEGRVGICINNHGWIANTIIPMVKELNPDVEVVFMDAWKNEEGKQYSHIVYPSCAADGSGFFGINASDEVVKKVLEIQNAIATDLDLYKRLYYGEEGVDHTMVDGVLNQTADQVSAAYSTEHGLRQTFCVRTIDIEDFLALCTPVYAKAVSSLQRNPVSDYVYCWQNFTPPTVNEAYNDLYSEVKTVYWEFYINAVTGKVDIDAEWDSYLEQLNAVGLQEILDEYNAMF